MSASSNAGMALNEHRRGARTKHALGAWVRAVQTSALRFFTVCLFGQTAAFNDVYNLMSLGDPHPCMPHPVMESTLVLGLHKGGRCSNRGRDDMTIMPMRVAECFER